MAEREAAWGSALVSFAVLVTVALVPFVAWAVFVSATYSLGERSREIGSLYVLVLLARAILLGAGALVVLVVASARFGVHSWGQQALVGAFLGLLAAAAMLLWSRAIAPDAKLHLLPGFGEAMAWAVVGVSAALVVLVSYSRLRPSRPVA